MLTKLWRWPKRALDTFIMVAPWNPCWVWAADANGKSNNNFMSLAQVRTSTRGPREPTELVESSASPASPWVHYDRKLCHDRKRDKSVIFFQRRQVKALQEVPCGPHPAPSLARTTLYRPCSGCGLSWLPLVIFSDCSAVPKVHYVDLTFNDCHAPYPDLPTYHPTAHNRQAKQRKSRGERGSSCPAGTWNCA